MTTTPQRLLVLFAITPAAVVVIGGLGSTVLQSVGLMPLVGPSRLSADAFATVAT